MRKTTDIQNRIVDRIVSELNRSGVRVRDDITSLVNGSPTDDVYRRIRAEKGFEIYVYEDGEADVNGPSRKRNFEKPDFDSIEEMEAAIVEEVILQVRPGEIPGELSSKLENRRKRSQLHLVITLGIVIVGSLVVWLRSRS